MIRNWFRKKEQPKEIVREVMSINPATIPFWDDIGFLRTGWDNDWSAVPVVNSCLSAIANPIASATISGGGLTGQLIEANLPKLSKHLVTNWNIHGLAIAAIYPFPLVAESDVVLIPSACTIEPNGDVVWNNITFVKDSLVYMFNPNPDKPQFALPPLYPCKPAIDAWYAVANWRKRMLVKLPAMVGTVSVPQQMAPAKAKELGKAIDNVLGLTERSTIVIDGGATFTMPDINDLSMQAIVNQCEIEVTSVMRVPPQIVGIIAGLDASTYSNYEQAERTFYANAVIPMARNIEDALQRIDQSIQLEVEVPEYTAVSEDKSTGATGATNANV